MFNPFSQYSVLRSSGLTVFGSICFVAIFVLSWPFVSLAMWAAPKKEDFGKFKDREQFNLNDKE